jgi:uncharacterized protein
MANKLIPLTCGILFGMGLVLSNMVNPDRVLGFLDILGMWDPTLAFVMGGALIPMGITWFIRRSMTKPLAYTHFVLPATDNIDKKLVFGAVLFGLGWGLVGFCPGPALAVLPLDGSGPFIFVGAMLAGMALHKIFVAKSAEPETP